MKTKDPFLYAFARLQQLVPTRVGRVLRWLHRPASRTVRLPLAVLCIIGSFFSFLPLLGLELFPIGLLLLAHDVKSLRRPAGRLTLWLLDRYELAVRYCRLQQARWNDWCACVKREGHRARRPVWSVRAGLTPRAGMGVAAGGPRLLQYRRLDLGDYAVPERHASRNKRRRAQFKRIEQHPIHIGAS